jgi:hypothetical protein
MEIVIKNAYLIFALGLFLMNKPSVVWVLSEKKELYE